MPRWFVVRDRLRALSRDVSVFQAYSVLFCLATFALFLQWPIVLGDTDLWFHLDYGRYILQHRALPTTTFFSFLPTRELLDQSWLFQIAVHQLHAWWGYYGLIGLRALMYLAVALLIVGYLFKGRDSRASLGWLAFIGVASCLLILPRYANVRPHIFTYTFIMVCLALVDSRSKWTVALPVVAVLWCNIHAMTYPVLLGIVVSYGIEYVIARMRGSAYDVREAGRWLLPLGLSTAAILLTPNGFRLLEFIGTPAQPMTYEAQVVNELVRLRLDDLLFFQAVKMVPSFQTVFNLFVAMTVLAAGQALFTRKARVSHILLCLGGALLLTKGVRFRNEFVLLALPLLKANPLVRPFGLRSALGKPAASVVIGLLLIMPALCLQEMIPHFRYPFSARGLPHGVAGFLNRLNVGGAVLNEANTGGYLRWMLYPRYRIFMDMENPLPFTDEDLYLVGHLFDDETLLRRTLAQYDPSFISVSLSGRARYDVMARFPDYVLVFFDDAEALYLNTRHHPALAGQYALKGVNPFILPSKGAEVLDEEEGKALLPHLPRLLELYPDGALTNRLAAWAAGRDGRYQQMLQHGDVIIRNFPESSTGYQLCGDALRALGQSDRALADYRVAVARAAGEVPRQLPIYRAMGLAYAQRGEYRKAYRAFDTSLDAFAPQSSREDLYILATLARLAGKPKTAYGIFRYLYNFKTAPDEMRWAQRLKEEMARIRPDQDPDA